MVFAATPVAADDLSIVPIELPGQAQGSVLATERGFVLTWIEREPEAAVLRFAELDHDAAVRRQGEITRGRGWFVNWADFPMLAIADNGDWQSFVLVKSDASKPYAYDIHTTRSTDRGQTWSSPQVLHDDGTTTEHGFVSLLADGGDRVLAVWLDGRHAQGEGGHDGDEHATAHTALHSAVITRDGIVERHELDELTCDCCRTIALRTEDGPLVAYRNRSPAEVRDIYAMHRRGADWTLPERVFADNWTMPGCPVNGPATSLLGKTPLIAWPTQSTEGITSLRLAIAGEDGWRRLPDLDRGSSLVGRVDLAPWGSAGALASWVGVNEQGQSVLLLARLDQDGKAVERHVVATLPAGRNTGMPRIAAAQGRAMLVWTDPQPTGPRLAGVLIRDAVEPGEAPAAPAP